MVFSFTQPRVGLLLALALAGAGTAQAQSDAPSVRALAYFSAQSQRQGLQDGDVTNPSVTSSYFDQSSGLTHTYLRQRVNGLDVYGAVGDVHTDRTGKPVVMHQGFVANASRLAPSATPTLTAAQAVNAAAAGLRLPRPVGLTLVKEARPADGLVFNNGGISENGIPARLMYLPIDGGLKLVWDVTIAQLDQQHHWAARVDAHTGNLLDKSDYVVSEEVSFQQLTARALGQRTATTSPTAPAPAPTANRGTLGGPNSLTVFAMPLEAPTFGARTTVPFSSIDTRFSPYGWQVADPRAPTGFFPGSYSRLPAGVYLTRGNNVAAYDDSPSTASGNGNLLSNVNSPNGGQALDFDFPFDQTRGPKPNASAAITNLFYWNNILHDVMQSKGFDEAAGNFQFGNTTGRGAGGDFVRAEAQDGSGRNNANMSTPPDGSSGRMQMYLWDGPTSTRVTAPSSIAADYTSLESAFSTANLLANVGPKSGPLALYTDASGTTSEACTANPAMNLTGKIAVIYRGNCNFTLKVKEAETRGAIAVLMINNVAGAPIIMGGADNTITIPAVMISQADGAILTNSMASGTVMMTLSATDFDGSVDNFIVAHELGHGISNRLTGGPANSNCVTQQTSATDIWQCMGEGWSDFFGLWVTTRLGDVGRTPRGTGTYASGEPTTGAGIRTKFYTDNMAVNNNTFALIGRAPYNQTHAIGEVWAATLWDLNWQFIYRQGFNPDFMAATGGNNRFLKLVLDGCKLQVCNPGFLDGRDAILRADSLANGGANSALIWTMFARRGMGFSANQGPRVAVTGYPNGLPGLTGIVAAFDMPRNVTPATVLNPNVTPLNTKNISVSNGSLVSAYPNPAENQLTIQSQLPSKTPVQISVVSLIGQSVISTTATAAEVQRGLQLNTSTVASGLYVVRVSTSEGTFTTKVQVRH